jgi:hypothetical protein
VGKSKAKPKKDTGPGDLTPAALWRIKEPWDGRPADTLGNASRIFGVKTSADGARSMATGWRPPALEKFRSLERRAVIYGGLVALQAGGIEPWVRLPLDRVPPIKLVGDDSARVLLKFAATDRNKPFKDLTEAAEHIRKQVKNAGLEAAAWYARGLTLINTALVGQKKQGAVEAAVATGLGATSTALTGTVVGIIAVPFVEAAALVTVGLTTRTAAEQMRSNLMVQSFSRKFAEELDLWALRQKRQVIRDQQLLIASQLEAAQAEQEEAEQAAQEQADKIVSAVQVTSVLLGLVITGIVIERVARRRKE